MFDVFYIGSNTNLKEVIPFAKQVESIDDITSKTKMYWLIEPNIEIVDYDVFSYRPEDYDTVYEHVWKWDSKNYGGLRLKPNRFFQGLKEVNKIVCKKSFDTLHTKTPAKYFDNNPYASHVWCVDKEYKLDSDINWAPDNFEPDFIHSFHLRGQLEHKYPAEEGGIKLYPRDWKDAYTKYHKFLDIKLTYPVMLVTDVDNYRQRNTFNDDYVWLVDAGHNVNLKTFDWVPSPFEDNMTHVFRMPYQLQEKYPMAMGGIRLVPKKWKEAEIKIHPACPIEDESYDVFYIDDDEFTAETYSEYADRSKTDWFWIVDREFTFNGKLLFVPAIHEREFIHVFKLPGHLEERYPPEYTDAWDNRCGGIRLMHKDFDITKHKYQDDVVPVRYDIFYTDNINDYDSPARKSRTKMFWLVDSEHELNDVFKYVPSRHDQKTIQVFKIPNQLEHKYPRGITNISDNRCGGVKLVPKNFNTDTIKYVAVNPTSDRSYPVVKVDNVDEYTEVFQDCWIVDTEYELNQKIEWTPPLFQQNCIHTFHVGDQLRHKYPESMGGLRWVPVDWNGDIVIHSEMLNAIPEYPIYYQDDSSVNPNKDHSCWVADSSYRIDESIKWAPDSFDTDKVHVFHIHNQLTNKYPEEMGGLYWYPQEPTEEKVIHTEPLVINAKTYPILRVTNPTDFSSVTEDCWLVDEEYILDDIDFDFVPWQNNNEKDQVHVYQVSGQLEHKYPKEMGGVYWVPTTNIDAELNIHNTTPFGEQLTFPVFDTEEKGRQESTSSWFWVVASDVEVLDTFDFTFVPKIWDHGKTHVWQKLHPITGRQYDYAGIQLCPKVAQTTGRPKYIREPACKQMEYPVYHLQPEDYKDGLNEVYVRLTSQSTTDMFWVVDAFTTIHKDFKFDVYPTQWDKNNVHVFADEDGNYNNIRLVPKQTFIDNEYTDKEIANNTFKNLKQMNTIASYRPKWPIVDLVNQYPVYHIQPEDYKEGLHGAYVRLAGQTSTDMFWVVDSFTMLHEDFNFEHYPTKEETKYVHVFADQNNEYKNVRLISKSALDKVYTNKEIANNSFEHLKQINTIASLKPKWPVIHLQSLERDEFVNAIKDIETPFVWTTDPDIKVNQKVLDSGFMPDIMDINKIHTWQKTNPRTEKVHAYGGLRLWPTEADYTDLTSDTLRQNKFRNLKYVKEPGSVSVPNEVFVLSYKEDLLRVEEHIAILEQKGLEVTHVRGVEGIFEAHKACAEKCNTKMFWVVDADAEVTDAFEFNYIPDVYDEEVVHVWASSNPINGLEYGYGGVKLFPTEMVKDANTWGIDFTTGLSNRFKSMPEVSCVTKFNTDAFSTWRSAFRECVKLTLNGDAESQGRLDTWLNTRGEEDFTADAVKGALEGNQFALANKDNLEQLNKINDYAWLEEQWNQ